MAPVEEGELGRGPEAGRRALVGASRAPERRAGIEALELEPPRLEERVRGRRSPGLGELVEGIARLAGEALALGAPAGLVARRLDEQGSERPSRLDERGVGVDRLEQEVAPRRGTRRRRERLREERAPSARPPRGQRRGACGLDPLLEAGVRGIDREGPLEGDERAGRVVAREELVPADDLHVARPRALDSRRDRRAHGDRDEDEGDEGERPPGGPGRRSRRSHARGVARVVEREERSVRAVHLPRALVALGRPEELGERERSRWPEVRALGETAEDDLLEAARHVGDELPRPHGRASEDGLEHRVAARS